MSLVSSNEVGRFSSPSSRTQSGVNILSDSGVNIDASAPTDKKRKKILEAELEKIKNGRVGHIEAMNTIWKCAETTFNSLRGVLDDSSQQRLDGKPVEGNIYLLDQLRKNLEDFTINFASDLQRFISASSDVAKDNFNIFYLQSQIDSLENENKLDENKSTGAHVYINSEFMSLSTNDETGNMRTNPTSGIALNANCVLVSGTKNGVVSDNSMICMEAENITMDTSKCKYSDAERKNGSCTSQGEVNINTKSLNVESFDYKIENEEKKVDKLSGEGQVCIKTMGVLVDTSDEKKKAAGYVSVNSNIINLTSYDSDNGSKVAPSGQINMGANKVKVGTAFEGLDSESVQMVSKTTNVVGVETATIGMGKEGKDAEVSLSGKVVSVVGQSLESSTQTSSFNEVKILKKLTAPDAEIANLNTNGQLNAGAISNNAPKVPNANKPLNNTAKAAVKQDAPAKKEDIEKKKKAAKILKQYLVDDD